MGGTNVWQGTDPWVFDHRDRLLYVRDRIDRVFCVFCKEDQNMKHVYFLINALVILLLSEQGVSACSVCFLGDSNKTVIFGLKSAIVVLLGGLLIVMAALVKFFISIARRSKHS